MTKHADTSAHLPRSVLDTKISKLETSRTCRVPQPLSAETAVARAIKRNPATMTKVARGQRPARFQAYTVSQLLETYRDPRAVLLEIASMSIDALCKLAKCSPMEALQEKRLCAAAALPYVCSKMPISVDMKHTKAITLNIVDDAEYQALVEISQQPEQPDDADSFSIALTSGVTDVQTINGDAPESTATTKAGSANQPASTPPQRSLSWDVQPGDSKIVTGEKPVTPGAAATIGEARAAAAPGSPTIVVGQRGQEGQAVSSGGRRGAAVA
jgi:hypothetical protein